MWERSDGRRAMGEERYKLTSFVLEAWGQATSDADAALSVAAAQTVFALLCFESAMGDSVATCSSLASSWMAASMIAGTMALAVRWCS